MSNANRFFLNTLRAGSRTLANPGTGVWQDDEQGRDFLSKFAADIDLTGQIEDPHAAHSVPSVFARPILFYQALKDKNNPLHDVLVREWRGLLAVFGLQSWLGYNITVRPYEVPPEERGATSVVGSVGVDNLHLRTILRQQLPKPEEDWERWWLVYCNDTLIGATSPWSVLYTPAQYKAPMAIPWRTGEGLLDDPIREYDKDRRGNSRDLAILYRWVQFLAAGANSKWNMPAYLQPQAGVISDLLTAWLRDLARYQQETITFDRLSFPKVDYPPYDKFTAPLPPIKDGNDDSDLLIDSAKLGIRQVLALSRKLSPGDRVQGSVLASQLDFGAIRGAEGTRLRTLAGREISAEYVFPAEAFFPNKLIAIPLSGAAMQCGASKVALPLTPKFFEYFDLDDLAKRQELMSVEESEDTIYVSLRLKLKGGKTSTYEKTYNRSTDVITLSGGAPGLAVWPDRYAADWRENFAAYNWPILEQGPDFRVVPLFADGKMGDESVNDNTQKTLRLWQCEKFVIGFALRYRDAAHDVKYDAGVVVRGDMRPTPEVEAGNGWEVGVDFGTSSTTVMVKRRAGDIELLPLQGRTVFLTDLPDNLKDRRDDISRNLYPSATVVPPFRTLLYDSAATVVGARRANYVLRFEYEVEAHAKPVANLKWGTRGAEDRAPLQHYLAGLVRYIVWEARREGVSELAFKWSYPLSLPDKSFAAMKTFWTNLGMVYVAASGPAGAGFAADSAPASGAARASTAMKVSVSDCISESEAVCRCLADLRVVQVRGGGLTIALDVGGGSSDVGIWSSQNLLDQFSFKLAGNDILIPKWLEYPNFLADLYAICTNGTTLPPQEQQRVQDRAGIYFNHLLAKAAEAGGLMPGAHPVPMAIHGGRTSEEPWLYIRTLAYLFFSGISFYVGLHARKYLGSVHEVKVCYCGRGVSLLSWITNQEEKAKGFLMDAVLEGLQYGPEGKTGVDVSVIGLPLSNTFGALPALKQEVARGLLGRPLGGEVLKKTMTFVGESEWSDANGKVEWDRLLGLEEMSRLRPPSSYDSNFIAWLKTSVLPKHAELGLDIDRLKQLRVQTSIVQQEIGSAGDEQILQPIFACELKALMQDYIEKLSAT